MKILTILGARPQFIKAGAVSREIAKHTHLKEVIVHTGQHYDANMSDIFFEELHLSQPDYFLGIGGCQVLFRYGPLATNQYTNSQDTDNQ